MAEPDELKPEEAKEFLISIGKYNGTIYDQPTPLYDAQGTRMRLKAVQEAFQATSNIIGVIAVTAIGSMIINTIKMEEQMVLKTIKVKEETKAKIDRFGFAMLKKKTSYDEVLNEALRMAYRWSQNKKRVQTINQMEKNIDASIKARKEDEEDGGHE